MHRRLQYGYYDWGGRPEPPSEPQPADMAGLLQDVLDHPDNDRYRLVFADYSEDVGQPDVARFIRGDRSFHFKARHFHDWYFTPTLQKVFTGSPDCGVELVETWPAAPRWRVRVIAHACAWELFFRVGFVEAIRLPSKHWMKHGWNLAKEFPLLRVELSDKEPGCWSSTFPVGPAGHAGWRSDGVSEFGLGPDGLCFSLFAKLTGEAGQSYSSDEKYWRWYADPAAAHDALSTACLALVDAPASRVTSSRR